MEVRTFVLGGIVSFILATINGLPSNSCVSIHPKDSKKWGQKCQFLCNCRNNSQCLSNGVCPQGCAVGWHRINSSSPCSQPSHTNRTVVPGDSTAKTGGIFGGMKNDIHKMPISRENNDFRPISKDPASIDESEQGSLPDTITFHNSLDQGDLIPFSFTSEMTCKRKESFIEMSWMVNLSVILAVKYVYVRYHTFFPINGTSRNLEGEYTLRGTTKPTLFSIPLYADSYSPLQFYIVRFKNAAFFDSLRMNFKLEPTGSCRGKLGTAIVLLYGVPICPSRRWGLQCEKFCRCPCFVSECHPLTGSCLRPVFFCPGGTYGVHCKRKCSKSCQATEDPIDPSHHSDLRPSDTRNSCHVVSGFCQTCTKLGLTGLDCNVHRDPKEVGNILKACSNATHFPGRFDTGLHVLPMTGDRDEVHGGFEEAMWHGQMALIFISTMVVSFLLCFLIYIMVTRYLARRKLRNYLEALDRQRMLRSSIRSWSELREEFKLFGRLGIRGPDSDIPSSVRSGPMTAQSSNVSMKDCGTAVDVSIQTKKVCFKSVE